MLMNVVIPMAGEGSRFSKAGFEDPKPFIPVNKKLMIQLAVESLGIQANFIFIIRKDFRKHYDVEKILNSCCNNPRIIEIDYLTDGPASSVLLAKEYIDNDLPLLISNCDQYLDWNSHDFFHKVGSFDGAILTYKSEDPKNSFVATDDFGDVFQTAEKKVISNDASVGTYYWKKGSDFVRCAEEMINKNDTVNNEYYICPVYNYALTEGKQIKTYDVSDGCWLIGTPRDLSYFLENYEKINTI